MAEIGSIIDAVYRCQLDVRQAVLDERGTSEAVERKVAETALVAALAEVRENGDVAAALEAERVLLRDEYDQFANTPTMKGSLEAALDEVNAALAMVKLVDDPPAYRSRVDETHRVRKHRIGDVPRDDARMFFRGHRSRLGNLMKARGTDEEKAVLAARSASMRAAEKTYESLQQDALGIDDSPGEPR